MASFDVNGIKLRVPGHCLTPPLKRALESGTYEGSERAALERHLRPDDTVLDIGAGAGYLSILASRVVGGENVVSVEASPVMMDVLRANLNSNGAREAALVHGAVVGDSHDGDTIDFLVRDAFWASSIAPEDGSAGREKMRSVPALKLSSLLEIYKPSIVTLDVEGGEVELCQQPWPDHVRLVIMEIHTKIYGPATIQKIFDGMSRTGMTIMPFGTRGEVITLQRVYPGEDA
ncbi:FkbM family methyltransferase [Aliiroseovarius subalbicans]|uniref:FkbM family methyltransferase n=1 Tax=Aliiroseovarius subalbicans TaxID=2925840 RepID=UPI001F576596|nr:FkbM family methyltransferase [Aliiroseovarius subalbicans]MCI2400305.1 FkbM family methyltransferase [Aliiroseovarius subalbicans]